MNTLNYIPDPIKQTETNVFLCSPVKFFSGFRIFKQGSDSVCHNVSPTNDTSYVSIHLLPMC